ncbi:hypothetical protein ACVWW1_000566 [Bradyrhizobium sp. JR3.5]
MRQALHRSSLVPRRFVVKSAYYEGNKAIVVVRATRSVVLIVPTPKIWTICRVRGLPLYGGMGSKSREYMFGATVRHLAERAANARRDADILACQAWNARMLAFQGPAQAAFGDALNAGYRYLEVKCLGCETHRPTRPSRSTLCGARSRRRFTS